MYFYMGDEYCHGNQLYNNQRVSPDSEDFFINEDKEGSTARKSNIRKHHDKHRPVFSRRGAEPSIYTNEVHFAMSPYFLSGLRPSRTSKVSDGNNIYEKIRNVERRKQPDFVLVYKSKSKRQATGGGSSPGGGAHEKHEQRRTFFQESLLKEGVRLELDEIDDNAGMTFVKMFVPFDLACRVAEKLQIKKPVKVTCEVAEPKRSELVQLWHRIFECNCLANVDTVFLSKTDLANLDHRRKSASVAYVTHPFSVQHINNYMIESRDLFFTNPQRIEIAWEILQNAHSHPMDEKKRGVEELLAKNVYETAFPLHEGDYCKVGQRLLDVGGLDKVADEMPKRIDNGVDTVRQTLNSTWASWNKICSPQPLNEIRNYFGEKISFYFAFMDFYTKMLVLPSAFGVVAFMFGMLNGAYNNELTKICDPHKAPGSYHMCPICQPPNCEMWTMAGEGCQKYKWQFQLDNEATLILSCFTIFWAILFLKLWKRRESTLAVEWDSYDVQERDNFATVRPSYEEKAPLLRKNPVTMETEPHMPKCMRTLRTAASVMATFLILAVAGACLTGLVISRIALYGVFRRHFGHHTIEYVRWLVHGLIFVMVLVFEKVYHHISHKLTSLECPKTNNQFLSSLLWKMFIFELLIDFVPIGYAAWMKGRTVKTPLDLNFASELCDGGCLMEVTELIAVLLLARLVIGNIVEVGWPFVKNIFRQVKEDKHVQLPRWVKDFHLNEVELDGVYGEYMEMMIQFAFIVLFIPAFPMAPLVCLMNNIVEIRVDAINMLRAYRRPVPMRVPGIQIWNHFLDIIVKLGVLCNAALIAFTSDIVPKLFFKYHSRNMPFKKSYVEWSLSKINVHELLHSHGIRITRSADETDHELDELRNITECWYQDFRESHAPYAFKPDYWMVLFWRIVAFSLYALIFFIFMRLVDVAINDVHSLVSTRIARHKYLIGKFFEDSQTFNTVDGKKRKEGNKDFIAERTVF